MTKRILFEGLIVKFLYKEDTVSEDWDFTNKKMS